jgi:hypothetical protein
VGTAERCRETRFSTHLNEDVILSDRSAAKGVEGPAFAFLSSPQKNKAVILSDRSAAKGVEGPAFALRHFHTVCCFRRCFGLKFRHE